MSLEIPEDQYTKVDGINTRFWSMGDAGPNVILIHGIGGYVEMWENNIERLSQNYRVYAMDLAGFGRSDKPNVPYSFPFLSKFVLGFMEALGIDRASLIGNSMGGGISLQVALQSPDKVDKLVLVNSAGLGKELTIMFRLASLPLIGGLLSRPSRNGVRKILRECVYDKSLISDDFAERGYRIATVPGAHKAFLIALRSSVTIGGLTTKVLNSFLDKLHTIQAPTLVIWGRQDRILPVAHAHVAEEKIPEATIHIFDPCGHMPQIERPEEFNTLVLNFLLDQ
jgi:4,5:9,10-diseco-3-hydroxy-5,9,17-trioxoandrosta-1(10),2-diene-4-oate hydrolase